MSGHEAWCPFSDACSLGLLAPLGSELQYLGQRWEREEGVSVHHHEHQKLGLAYALESEVAKWRDSRRRALEAVPDKRRKLKLLT